MLPEVKEMYIKVKELHEDFYKLLVTLRDEFPKKTSMEELADTVFALKRISKFINDNRTMSNAVAEKLEKIACVLWVGAGMGDPIRTEYVTASPDVTMIPRIPHHHKDAEEYAKLMDFMGVRQDARDSEGGVMRPHWPAFVQYYSKLVEEGKPTPPGIDPTKSFPDWSLKCLKQKEVDA